ncbi:MAG: TonB-dependent receptor [Notoacmeibacter sp.]|nr:TonB-dependent receptor [Notoacmeibacter sp.]
MTEEAKIYPALSMFVHEYPSSSRTMVGLVGNIARKSDRLKEDWKRRLVRGVSILTLFVAASTSHASEGFVISYDDEVIGVDGERVMPVSEMKPDLGLREKAPENADVRVTFDGLEVKPRLNVSTSPVKTGFQSGQEVGFAATTNYSRFVSRSEILIYVVKDGGKRELVERLPAQLNGQVSWRMPEEGEKRYEYVLRVYDDKERFDETVPLPLIRTAAAPRLGEPGNDLPGTGEDRTAFRNIPVYGGSITVSGDHVPQAGDVIVMGEAVPVDADGKFVIQKIVPPGDHTVEVRVPKADGTALTIERDVNIPANEWFYVGLADITIGARTSDKGIKAVKPGEFEDVYSKGRLAFYLKGKIKGEYLLTAAADTGEGKLSTLFKGLDEKDARSILRRLDPDDYYPVYGDDSTFEEDAPTQGKFYVRLERGDSHIMWGNYKVSISNTKFLSSNRALYGASARYRSPDTTRFGDSRVDVRLYAAQPGTLPQRDVFRGTGGSAYFLKQQDITTGSETVVAEVRDPVTGIVRERKTLIEGQDYEIDYMQGVLILKRPLPSITGTSDPVRSSANGGNEVWLIVSYEYTPVAGKLDGYVYGGRAETWLNDHLRIGVSGMNEKTETADQIAAGADILLRKSDRTFIEAEVAASRGPGFTSTVSTDGGLTGTTETPSGRQNLTALAWRVKGEADLAELTEDRIRGTVGAYVEERQGGFQTLAWNTSVDERIWGAHATVELNRAFKVAAKYDEYSNADGSLEREGKASLTWLPAEGWKVAFGLGYVDLSNPLATVAGYNGERMDGGLRIEREFSDDFTAYAFGQATLMRNGSIRRNNRVGAGAVWQVTEQVALNAEASYGDSGWGGLAGITYDPNADNHYYIGYKLDPDRAWTQSGSILQGTDYGTLVVGTKRKLSDELSVFAESDFDLFGKNRTLGQTYGVSYSPTQAWVLTGGIEAGQIRDNRVTGGVKASDFDRVAVSASALYKDEESGLNARIRGEYRHESSTDKSRDADHWLGGLAIGWKPTEDLRVLGSVDAVFADSKGSSIRDGQYVEASIAAAYRPVEHDRFNMLFKYTFLHDLPGPQQVNAVGDMNGPSQQSHIVSIDGNYDVNRWLTLGAKYGARFGRRRDRGTQIWSSSDAHLGIVRADLHVVHKWDLMVEARALHLTQTKTTDFGFLAAAYRHVGDNFKFGVGYNFGRFSDDMRDLTYDDQGVFVNMVGKF